MHTDDELLDDAQIRPVISGFLTIVALGGAIDLYLDQPTHWLTAHVMVELALMVSSAGLAVYLSRGWERAAVGLRGARASLAAREAERNAWRARAESTLAGLAAAIDEQFSTWQLTPTEREVAWLLLKGSGHKQIAGSTGRSERTVRQHAVAVYEKSGLHGRAELAAFFLEGLSPKALP